MRITWQPESSPGALGLPHNQSGGFQLGVRACDIGLPQRGPEGEPEGTERSWAGKLLDLWVKWSDGLGRSGQGTLSGWPARLRWYLPGREPL